MAERDERGLFQPGNATARLGGRPKGSRNRLGEAFLEALANDFDQHGVKVIETVRVEDPVAYVKVCASILPKELNIKVDDDLTDDQLDDRIRQLANLLGLAIEGGAGAVARAEEGTTRH